MLIQILLYILTVEWSTGLVSISIFYLSNYFYLPIFLLSIIFIRFVLPNACIICVCLRSSPLIRLLCFYLLALHALYYSFYFTLSPHERSILSKYYFEYFFWLCMFFQIDMLWNVILKIWGYFKWNWADLLSSLI